MTRFLDSSGRLGPATWVAGRYPEGKADCPVKGVSWSKAADAADMFGNVAEWAYNSADNNDRYTLALTWSDPTYNITLAVAAPPWTGLQGQGFQLVSYPSGMPDNTLIKGFSRKLINLEALESIADEAYAFTVTNYTKKLINISSSKQALDLANGFSAVHVEIDYSFSNDKLPLLLLIAENIKPPYQTLI